MINRNPLLLVDSYKVNHQRMYPDGMTKLYSNFTPRKSRIKGVNEIVVFGTQHFILEYLIKGFDEYFFYKGARAMSKDMLGDKYDEFCQVVKNRVIEEYARHCPVDTKHMEDLWDLQYLPIEIKALEEGTLCPIGVPCLTITNTHPKFAWVVNYLETLLSCMMWQPITSATIAFNYKKILSKYAIKTTGSAEGIQWQGHDFSMRGMSSVESAILSGMGHLTSFTGTDTIPAIYQLEESYGATGLIGASVPATEHSVMCMGTKEAEIDTFRRLLQLYPKDILSVVSDTWDLWEVCTKHLPALKEEILARNGKLVIRPDSGDPVDIICGHKEFTIVGGKYFTLDNRFMADTEIPEENIPACKGVIELLWEAFGGTIVTGADGKQYKQLDSHIGAIYGDSITTDRAEQICQRLAAKGFASTNVVLGIGSYTYQYNTRDTFGFAMKATYGEITRELPEDQHFKGMKDSIECREIFKDPITDDGTKKSKKGLLQVVKGEDGKLKVIDQCTWEQEAQGELKTVFKDGALVAPINLDQIRAKMVVIPEQELEAV